MTPRRVSLFRYVALMAALFGAVTAHAQQQFITVASTTSTVQSGLFKDLLPPFEKKTGIQVRVAALGTGQAIDLARRGNADVVFVHARAMEEKFVAEGYGVKRVPVMYNDFLLVGPKSNPAKAAIGRDVLEALRAISLSRAPFVSRGDRSGTHLLELDLWKQARVDIAREKGPWYRNVNQGMLPTLYVAASVNGYALSDRSTWASLGQRGELTIIVEGDPLLLNQYSVILVNPQKHPHVKREFGQAFIDWLVSSEGQQEIARYRVGGRQVFFPNAAS